VNGLALLDQTYRLCEALTDARVAAEEAKTRRARDGRKGAEKRISEGERAKAEVLALAREKMRGEGLRRFRSVRELARAILKTGRSSLSESRIRTLLTALARDGEISWLVS
jgi:hypothetical protein